MANNLAFTRGTRLVLASVPHAGDAGHDDPSDVTVRNTAAVRAAMAAARYPVTAGDLAGKVAEECPGASGGIIVAMLGELAVHRFLLSCLHPPADVTDPLGYLVGQLAGTNSAADAIAARLREIGGELDRLPGPSADLRP